jgi:hypothetical protein
VGQLDVESLGLQAFSDGRGQKDLVFDHQNAHGRDSDPPGADMAPHLLKEAFSRLPGSAVFQRLSSWCRP